MTIQSELSTIGQNTPFRMNIMRYKKVSEALAPYGLVLRNGVVIDETLPRNVHSVVGYIDNKKIDLEVPISLCDYPDVAAYIDGGRERRIKKFRKEQDEAAAWIKERNELYSKN
ncbi:hypothetical protein [Vibrio anguillarum]|uniref:Uncharacterized protein n=1 Tax=Vibrio anguillarum TaxID=55601 RepID=A0A7U6FS15_VIBAN|nr:hypothetical protein [Vibrio anguillarum]AZS26262.1 hypothetical protein DYL72_15245 [Vibrio anguillarum]MBF4374543.1 hypothetical protein [Vibrio anguillarum]